MTTTETCMRGHLSRREAQRMRKYYGFTPKAVAAAQRLPEWLPDIESPVPCLADTAWNQRETDDQIAACGPCPVALQCLTLGRSLTPAGIVWGGVLIGTPDHEQARARAEVTLLHA